MGPQAQLLRALLRQKLASSKMMGGRLPFFAPGGMLKRFDDLGALPALAAVGMLKAPEPMSERAVLARELATRQSERKMKEDKDPKKVAKEKGAPQDPQ